MCFIVNSPHATVHIDYHHTLIGMPMGHVLFVVVQQVSKVGCVRVLDGEFIHIDDPASCCAEKGQTDLQSKAAGITSSLLVLFCSAYDIPILLILEAAGLKDAVLGLHLVVDVQLDIRLITILLRHWCGGHWNP